MFLAEASHEGAVDHISPSGFGQFHHLPEALLSGIIHKRIFREMDGSGVDDHFVSIGMGADDRRDHAHRDLFRSACGNLDHFHVIENEVPWADLINAFEIFGNSESGSIADGQDASEALKRNELAQLLFMQGTDFGMGAAGVTVSSVGDESGELEVVRGVDGINEGFDAGVIVSRDAGAVISGVDFDEDVDGVDAIDPYVGVGRTDPLEYRVDRILRIHHEVQLDALRQGLDPWPLADIERDGESDIGPAVGGKVFGHIDRRHRDAGDALIPIPSGHIDRLMRFEMRTKDEFVRRGLFSHEADVGTSSGFVDDESRR